MINIAIFNSVAFVYLLASALYFCYFFFRKESIGKAATAVTGIGVFIQTLAYVIRWVETARMGFDHTPFSLVTLYENLIFASWSIVIAYLIIEYKYRIKALGAIILPITSLIILYACLSQNITSDIDELPTVLRGNLFAYHVVSCMASLVGFLISFTVSIVILMMRGESSVKTWLKIFLNRLPAPKILDDLSYKAIAIGFILFTIGMVTGIYRTKIIWGSYWSWDAVETSGLIMWLLYALVLHGRYQRWWSIRKSAVLSIVAFISSVLCFSIAGSYVMTSGHYPIQ